MNEAIRYNAISQTAPTITVFGMVAASLAAVQPLVPSHPTWPAWELPIFQPLENNTSYSPFFEQPRASVPFEAEAEFSREIVKIFAELLEGQEPLGAEFEAVLNENIERLYES